MSRLFTVLIVALCSGMAACSVGADTTACLHVLEGRLCYSNVEPAAALSRIPGEPYNPAPDWRPLPGEWLNQPAPIK